MSRKLIFSLFSLVMFLALVTACGGTNPYAPTNATPTAVQPTAVQPTATDAPAMAQFFPADDTTHGRFANDALLPGNLSVSSCDRPWQALNPSNGSKNATWIALLCDMRSSNPDATTMIFVQPWQLHISGKGEFYLVVIRDLRAVEQLKARGQWDGQDPYDVSVAGDTSKQSNTLSVYFKGSGKILDDKSNWIDMTESFYQVPFPKDFAGGWIFHFDFGTGGNATLWIGSTEYATTSTCSCNVTLHNAFCLPILASNK